MEIFKVFQLLLVFGALLGFGFWELYKLKRDEQERLRRKPGAS